MEIVHELLGWKILSHYLRVGTCFQELIMLNTQHNAHPGCCAVLMADIPSALPRSAQFAEQLGVLQNGMLSTQTQTQIQAL